MFLVEINYSNFEVSYKTQTKRQIQSYEHLSSKSKIALESERESLE